MEKNFNEILGNELRIRRIKKGYSLEYVARCMNVSKMSVSYWETGKRAMYATTFMKYCKILGCPAQDVFISVDKELSA